MVKENPKIVYPNLRRWVAENRISLIRVSEDLEIGNRTVYDFAYGTRDSRLSTAEKIAQYTGLTLGELLEKEENKNV